MLPGEVMLQEDLVADAPEGLRVSAQLCEGDVQGHRSHHSHSPRSHLILHLPPPITALQSPEPLLSCFPSLHGVGSNLPSLSLSALPRGSLSSPACVQGVPGAPSHLPPHVPLQALFLGLLLRCSAFSFPLLPPQPRSGGTGIKALVRATTGAVASRARMPQSHSQPMTRGRGEAVTRHPWLPAGFWQDCRSPRY